MMPTYEYRCPRHGKFTEIRLMSERHQPATCRCGEIASYTISAPRVFGDYEPYESPASGKWIEGKRAREEDFKRTGTREYDPGEFRDYPLKKAAMEAEEDRQMEETIDETIGELRSN